MSSDGGEMFERLLSVFLAPAGAPGLAPGTGTNWPVNGVGGNAGGAMRGVKPGSPPPSGDHPHASNELQLVVPLHRCLDSRHVTPCKWWAPARCAGTGGCRSRRLASLLVPATAASGPYLGSGLGGYRECRRMRKRACVGLIGRLACPWANAWPTHRRCQSPPSIEQESEYELVGDVGV